MWSLFVTSRRWLHGWGTDCHSTSKNARSIRSIGFGTSNLTLLRARATYSMHVRRSASINRSGAAPWCSALPKWSKQPQRKLQTKWWERRQLRAPGSNEHYLGYLRSDEMQHCTNYDVRVRNYKMLVQTKSLLHSPARNRLAVPRMQPPSADDNRGQFLTPAKVTSSATIARDTDSTEGMPWNLRSHITHVILHMST